LLLEQQINGAQFNAWGYNAHRHLFTEFYAPPLPNQLRIITLRYAALCLDALPSQPRLVSVSELCPQGWRIFGVLCLLVDAG
jgi:hypothetical protein